MNLTANYQIEILSIGGMKQVKLKKLVVLMIMDTLILAPSYPLVMWNHGGAAQTQKQDFVI